MYNGKLWITTHSGKMQNINSIGTSCANNPHCIKRRENNESVCAHCYADTYMKMRKALKEHLDQNAEILTKELINKRDLPKINAAYFRFESFGDIYNETHLKNYIQICENNPDTVFGLWSKNLWIMNNVFNKEGVEKPANLRIVASSILLNKPMQINDNQWYIDHVFTVYEPAHITENNVTINCGVNNCFNCKACYKTDSAFYINEQLK